MRLHAKASVTGTALVGLILAGCAQGPTKEEMTDAVPLSADQIEAAVVGNTLYQTGYSSDTKWEWAGYFAPDGTGRGKAWWPGGKKTGTADYEITSDDRWCHEWDNFWDEGNRNCFQVYREGDELHFLSDDAENETFTVKEGNAYDL